MKRGFTLVELLVVVAIISILTAASIMGYSKIIASADRAKCTELVKQVSVALTQYYQNEGVWPKRLLNDEGSMLNAEAVYPLVKTKLLSLSSEDGKLIGYDRFGMVTPWGMRVVRQLGKKANLNSPVPTGGTIKEHILRYAIDEDGDGIVKATVGGEDVHIRASAVVWSGGKDGRIERYSVGLKRDDCYSWTVGQTRDAQ